MDISKDKKIYFASDNHLGAPSDKESRIRERKFILWLDSIKEDAEIIFLLGDLFDFWFEYKHSVPKGFTRTLGKLAELSDMGIKIYFFVGNHDYWMNDYFEKELGIKVFKKPEAFVFNSNSNGSSLILPKISLSGTSIFKSLTLTSTPHMPSGSFALMPTITISLHVAPSWGKVITQYPG